MIACVRLPHFVASLEEREHPELAETPFIVVDDASTGEVLAGASRLAARAGVRAGMGLAQARALCPGLVVRPAVHSRTRRAFGDLLDTLALFSAQVEPEDGLELRADGRQGRAASYLHPAQLDDFPAATCTLDLGPLPPDEALDLGQQMLRTISERLGLAAHLGVSSGRFPARVAATAINAGDVLVVPGGEEAGFLAGFTVALLPVDGETLRQLDLLGLVTLGQVAALPVAALLDRFGKQGRIMHRLAQGRDTSPVGAYQPPRVERCTRQLEGPVAQWEHLHAVLGEMLAACAGGLLVEGQTVRHLALVLTLDDGAVLERQVTLRQASADPGHLREVVAEMAQALTLTAGAVELELALSDINPAVARQLSLFGRAAVPQEHLSTVLKDLMVRYGEEHFYWARAVNREARLPERRYCREHAGREKAERS